LKEPIYKHILMLFHRDIGVYLLSYIERLNVVLYISHVITNHEVELDEVIRVMDWANTIPGRQGRQKIIPQKNAK
jgi:hypothetical protein